MTTKKGVIKKTKISMFDNIRKMGLIAVNLREDDELISVQKITAGQDMFLATKLGMSIRFNEADFRDMGRNATGVKAITLNKDDEVVAAEVIEEDKKILIVSENGFGKCTSSDEYRIQTRGGKGLKTYKITERTGNVIDVKMIDDREELIMVTSDGVIIRIRAKDISTTSRVTQGVKLINVNDDVKVMSVAKIAEDYIENDEHNENNENNQEDKDIKEND